MVMTVTLDLCFYKVSLKHSSIDFYAKQNWNNLHFQHCQKSQTAPDVPVSSSVAKKEWNYEMRSLFPFLDLHCPLYCLGQFTEQIYVRESSSMSF